MLTVSLKITDIAKKYQKEFYSRHTYYIIINTKTYSFTSNKNDK